MGCEVPEMMEYVSLFKVSCLLDTIVNHEKPTVWGFGFTFFQASH